MVRAATALLLLGALVGPSRPVAPQTRDARPGESVKSGTGSISGRVTDRETGQPLAGVAVTLGGPPVGPLKGRPLATHTDRNGSYTFSQLAPGPYSLTFAPPANRATHLPHVYGERRPLMPRFRRPYAISLRKGQRLDNADVALWRAFAISGRVIDENGEPMVNVDVHAFATDGTQFGTPETTRASDDRGAFRIFGLPPGRYHVCGEPRDPWQPLHAGLSMSPLSMDVRERPVRTCHPSALTDADAQLVAVTTADAENVEILLRRSRAFRVTGTVLTASGEPLNEMRPNISIVRLEHRRSVSQRLELQGEGRFAARGLAPGNYLLLVDKYGSGGGPAQRELARFPFTVDTSDLENLVVVMEKAARVPGRVIFEEAPARPAGTMRVGARMDPMSARIFFGPSGDTDVGQDLMFELTDLFGPGVIAMTNLPRNYYVKRVTYGTEDITDRPFDFRAGGEQRSLEILLSNRGAFVTGSVLDENGNRADDTVVLVFSTDRARWPTAAGVRVRALVPQRGPYTVGPLGAGEYFIVAVSGEDREAYSGEPEILEQLSRSAQRVPLAEGERRSLDLEVVTVRGSR